MDEETRLRRQREFTIYLVLFILLVIVGKITTNGQLVEQRPYYNYGYGNPYGSGIYSTGAYNAAYGDPFYNHQMGMYSQGGYGERPYMQPYGGGPPVHYNMTNHFYGERERFIQQQYFNSAPPNWNGWGYPAENPGLRYHEPAHFNGNIWGAPPMNGYGNRAYQGNPYHSYSDANYYNHPYYHVNPYQAGPYNAHPYHANSYQYQVNAYNAGPYHANPYQVNAYNASPYQAYGAFAPNNNMNPEWGFGPYGSPYGVAGHPYQANAFGYAPPNNGYANPMNQFW